MNHHDFLARVQSPGIEGLQALCMPGLVPAHGENRSLADLDGRLGQLLRHFLAAGRVYSGKVRDRIDLGDRVLLYTSDRVSAFDVILGLVPFKGEVLTGISRFWFEKTADIIENHLISPVGQRGLICRKAKVLPVEVVVRGYLTGSAWRDYQAGNPVSGIDLPRGMNRDQAFETPLVTPSTKADIGHHDQPISALEIVRQGLVEARLWQKVEEVALALFARGQEWARNQGLILVDTKYEFGLVEEAGLSRLILVDEVHTPDSSRYWYADTYARRFAAGEEQRKLDKEYLRSWLMDSGWSGQGTPPDLPLEVLQELSWRYVQAWQELTARDFPALSTDFQPELEQLVYLLQGEAANAKERPDTKTQDPWEP